MSVVVKKNKKVMPYVAMIRKEVEASGAASLQTALPFDEMDVLSENLKSMHELLSVLKVQHVKLETSEKAPPSNAEALPGAPGIGFSSSVAPDSTTA